MNRPKPPQLCSSMQILRKEIDMLDRELVTLMAQRAAYIDRAIELKSAEGLPARIPERVSEVVANVRAHAITRQLDPDLVEGLWRQLIDWSIEREAMEIALD